jgi:hypothetical protein
MSWEIEFTDEFGIWWATLQADEQEAIRATIEVLEERGPGLGRPHVDSVHDSRHANMKELRPRGGNIRILFAFDPRRTAILLIGGDKTDRWRAWYREMIPIADDLYDAHLAELRAESERL